MKKVLFFNISFYGGGVEKMLLDIAQRLDKEKYDVTIMVMAKSGAFSEQYLALKSKHIHIRQCFDYLTPGNNIFQKAVNVLKIKLAEKCLKRFPGIYYRLAIKEKFDIEVAFMHNQANAIIASSLNKKSRKIAWVHTDLRKLTTWKQYFGSRKRQEMFYTRFDQIVCISDYVKSAFLELFDVKTPIVVIHNPINESAVLSLSNATKNLPQKTKTRICAVGRLSHEKNFMMLLRVHKRLLERGFDHELWIVGEGTERCKLEAYIREENLNQVTLWGHQKNPYCYIGASDLTVCSSKYEGLHLASMESLALGKPVVSCCSVVKELFGSHECGIITENTEEAFYSGLCKILSNQERLRYYTKEAQIAGKVFSIEATISQIEKEVLEG